MDSLFGLLTCVAFLLAKVLIWASFSQSMFTFSLCINPCIYKLVCLFRQKVQIQKTLSTWVFVAPKCQQNFEILQLVCTLTSNKFWTKCLRCLIFAQTKVFHPYFYNYYDIHIIAFKS